MAQLAYHLALAVPTWKGQRDPVVEPSKPIQGVAPTGKVGDYRSLRILAAHTVPPGSEALFAQSLRNLWAVKTGG